MLKKVKIILILLFLSIAPIEVRAVSKTIEEQYEALIETAYAYHRQGTQIQYDSYRKNLSLTPEDATPKHTSYTVCSGYTYQVYKQALGIELPDLTSNWFNYYIKSNKNDPSTVLINYETSEELYVEDVLGNPNADSSNECISTTGVVGRNKCLIKEWKKFLRPGDLLLTSITTKTQNSSTTGGHIMMVTRVEEDEVYMTESGGGRYDVINYKDKYDKKINSHSNATEGSIREFKLSARIASYYNDAYSTGTSNKVNKLAIIRIINDGKTYLDMNGNKIEYDGITQSAQSRLTYPKIDIEKVQTITNDNKAIRDHSMVNLGEFITYSLTITNNSEIDYTNLNIQEIVDLKVNLIDAGNATTNGNELNWKIDTLKAGKSITLSYKVKIPNKMSLLGQIIVSTGKVDNIQTSKIEVYVGNRLTIEEENKILASYNTKKNKSMTERAFIDEIYKDSLEIDLGLTNLTNLDIIGYNNNNQTSGLDELSVKYTSINNDNIKKFIYNNYYGLRLISKVIDESKENLNQVVNYYNWNNNAKFELNDRARTISPNILEFGDVLLLYNGKESKNDTNLVNKAYIYIDNSLIRKIDATNFEILTGDELTTFLRDIIGENYILIRPSLTLQKSFLKYTSDINYSTIKENKDLIKYIQLNNTFQNIINNISTNGEINIFNKNDEKIIETNKVTTGDKLKISFPELEHIVVLSVNGDVTGRGLIDLEDVNKGYKILRKEIIVEQAYETAADYNKDGKLKINDIAKLYQELKK